MKFLLKAIFILSLVALVIAFVQSYWWILLIGLILGGIVFYVTKKNAPKVLEESSNQNVNISTKDAHHSHSSSNGLTPLTYGNRKRTYHYEDVPVWIKWEYGGSYGQSCCSIGIKRGDSITLYPSSEKDDPESVSLYWGKTHIGYMKTNRLRGMVQQWKAAKMPVLAVASKVGGDDKLLLELSFYGYVKKQ